MKKKIIAFFILAFISINAQQEDWTYITTLQETDYYYKLNSYNTAWTKEISKKTKYYPTRSETPTIIDGYQINLQKFDCSEKKMGIIQITTYSKSGKVLKTSKSTDYYVEMNYVIPDSLGESLLNAFCSKN